MSTENKLSQILLALTEDMKEKLTKNAKDNGLRNAAEIVRASVYYFGILHPEKAEWASISKETEGMDKEIKQLVNERQKKYASAKKAKA